MPDRDISPWPEDLFDFAWMPERDDRLRDLSEVAETEDWTYHHTPSDFPYPILFNYVRYTYRRLAEENKIALSDNGQFSCFNTGLVTPNQESLFASFEVNRRAEAEPWFFKGWFRRGDWELTKFPLLPDLAHYFDDPSCLVFDPRMDFRINADIRHTVRYTELSSKPFRDFWR